MKWLADDYGTALWQLAVMQAPLPFEGMQRMAGMTPGTHLLLRADAERQVKPVPGLIGAIEACGICPCAVAATYWRTVGNRLASQQAQPAYTIKRHSAQLARRSL